MTLEKSAMEKVSLLPATFVSTAAMPIRLLALLAFAKPAQPMAAELVHRNTLAAAACAESKMNAKPRLP